MSAIASHRALRSQAVRFLGVGALVTVLYLSLTTLLSQVAGMPFQGAVAVGYLAGVSAHFALHRGVVFTSEAGYALPMAQQFARFVLLVLIQYGITATSVAVVPDLLGLPRVVVWLATVALVVPVSFVLLRTRLFHPPTAGAGSPPGPAPR